MLGDSETTSPLQSVQEARDDLGCDLAPPSGQNKDAGGVEVLRGGHLCSHGLEQVT